jgi:integral membrane protein
LHSKIIQMKLFRFIAFLEGLSYLLLLFVATPVKYILGDPSYVKLLGMPHGVLFMAYIVFSVFMSFKQKWSIKVLLVVLLASIIPFGTFYVDKKYLK